MIISLTDDEYGHDLMLGGVIHRLELSPADSGDDKDIVYLHLISLSNSAFLDQDDVNALHKFLGRYATHD